MKYSLILLLNMFALISAAQNTFRPLFGFNVSVEHWTSIESPEQRDYRGFNKLAKNSSKSIRKRGSFCVNYCPIKTKKNILLDIGLLYANRGYSVFWPTLNSGYDEEYETLSLPIKANFKLGKKKLRLSSSIGFSVDYLLSSTTTFMSSSNQVIKTYSEPIFEQRGNITPFASLGLEFEYRSGYLFRFEGLVRQALLSNYKDKVNMPFYYLNSYGLNIAYYRPLF